MYAYNINNTHNDCRSPGDLLKLGRHIRGEEKKRISKDPYRATVVYFSPIYYILLLFFLLLLF